MSAFVDKIVRKLKGWLHLFQRRSRQLVIKCLRALPVSSKIIGPPKGFYATAKEWASCTGASANLKEIYSGRSNHRTAPITLDGYIPWEFDTFFEGRQNHEDPAFIVSVPHGRIYGEGTIISPDDRLIGDVSRELVPQNNQRKHSVFSQMRLPKLLKIDGTIAVLAVLAADVYWHCMFDLLPRIHLLSRSGISSETIDYYAINKPKYRFQEETIALTGLPKAKIIECGKDTHIEADKLIVPSLNQTVPAKWSCDYVRDLFISHEITQPPKRGARIYITRSDAKMRRISNEDELTRFLNFQGFETVKLTGMSVADQASVFASSDVIVAPHGSGLTNLVFCNPGTKVVELFSATYVNPCYWVLCNTVGLDYYCHLGTGTRPPAPPEGIDKRKWFFEHLRLDKKHGTDIFVNIDTFSPFLKRILSDSDTFST